MLSTNNSDYVPQYVKIQNYILSKINSGELREGDRIPSENEIAHMFSVSRITANTAIKELVTMGVIDRIKGKGSFVNSTMHTPTATNVFSNNVKINTSESVIKNHEVASIRLFKGPREVSEKFQISPEESIFEIIRVVKHYSKPKYVDYTYVPSMYLKEESVISSKLSDTYIHDYLNKYGSVKPAKVQIYLNTPIYEYLDLSYLGDKLPNTLFCWDTDIYDDDGALIAFTSTLTKQMPSAPFISFSLA